MKTPIELAARAAAASVCRDNQTHEETAADRDRFYRGTTNHRPWPGEPLILGECRHCGSTIALELLDPSEKPS